ncbi:MAG: LuxR C-terminal-related transcriptional regulator [Acidimicrobiia bacterium]
MLPLGLDGGAASPAVALFVERSRALRSAIDLDETRTAAVVVEVCRQVDGLPLGIELAAARTLSMSPIDLRDRLNDRLDVLGSATSRVPQRQQTLRHVVSWSYELLDEPERALLKQAAVFHGGFDAAGVAAVSGAPDELAVLDLLDSLVRKSLVVADHRSGNVRFGLLETVRQFAEDELAVQGTLEQARERHAAFFAEGAVARGSTWNGPAWRDCADWVDTELANLRSAFRWARSHDRLELAVDIAAHAAYMGGSIQLFECVAWAEELLEVAVDAEPIHLPRLYTAAAWGCFTGRPADAVDAARAAQRLEDDSRYEPYEAGLSGLMEALAHVYDGHLDRYVEAAERVVAVGGRARGWGLSLLLDGLQASGRVNEALALTEAAMAEARALGNPFFIAYAYWTCGGAHAKRDPARALELWRDGLDFVRRHRVDFFVGFIARDAARLHLADANPDDALAMFDESINVFERAGNVAQLTITLASATALLERIGRFDRAVTLFAAITRQPASEHHVPELAELGARLRATLGEDAFRAHVEEAATMDLNATAQFARAEVQRARVELQAQTASRVERPGGLSVREVEVLQLLAQGLRTQDIAKRLYISAKTADRHIQNLYLKIGASNRATATRWASEHGLMT